MTRYGVIYPDGRFSGDITDLVRSAQSYAKQHHGTVYEVGSANDPARQPQPISAPWFPDETEDFTPPRGDPDARTAEDDRLDDPRHGQAQIINASVFGSR